MSTVDKQFILDRNSWPSWPALPVKRYRPASELECGCLIDASDGNVHTVYMVNLFDLAEQPDSRITDCKKYAYPDVDAMLADGWKVD